MIEFVKSKTRRAQSVTWFAFELVIMKLASDMGIPRAMASLKALSALKRGCLEKNKGVVQKNGKLKKKCTLGAFHDKGHFAKEL